MACTPWHTACAGFCITGHADPDHLLHKGGLKAGQALLLSMHMLWQMHMA